MAVDTAVRSIKGDNTPAIILAVYGNRAYDDALVEMYDILSDNGFKIIAAGGFIGEHSYSNKLGGGRPDANDLQTAAEFGKKAAEKMQNSAVTIQVNSSRPYTERHPKASVAPDTNDD